MSLLDVRELFLKTSKRSDLVDPTTFADLGADAFLRRAQRRLDAKDPTDRTLGRHVIEMDAGTVYITVRDCFAVKEIWMASGTTDRWQLNELNWSDFRAAYPGLGLSVDTSIVPAVVNKVTDDTGAPQDYTVNIVRPSPQTDFNDPKAMENAVNLRDVYDMQFGDSRDSVQILWAPPMDSSYSITVMGGYYTWFPKQSEGTSFWIENQPDTLVAETMMLIERLYGNMTRAKAWKEVVDDDLWTMFLPIVEQTAHGKDRRSG